MIATILQILGALAILIAYILAQLGRTTVQSLAYLVLNLAGSLVLAALAAITSQWGFLLLEGAWALISVLGLVRRTSRLRESGRAGRGGPLPAHAGRQPRGPLAP